jgi:glycosyltransferase involved in cell wall biosynthesis
MTPGEINIIWMGSVVDEQTMLTSPGVSPAANRWQIGLITALRELGAEVTVLSYLPEPLWPKGRLHLGVKHSRLGTDFNGNVLGYWNIPFLREHSLAYSHRRALERIARLSNKRTVLITYNASSSYVAAGLYAKQQIGIPWTCIVADGDAPLGTDGCVFLPWGYFQEWHGGPKLHLDGGVSQMRFDDRKNPTSHAGQRPAILYSGAMTQHGGVDLLVRAFQKLPNPQAELWLCGKGHSPVVARFAVADHRIRLCGLVTEERLRGYCQDAAVFANPRPAALACNKKNFPSKVLEYMSYGRPIISTWTVGLSPEYRDVLVVVEKETPECFAAAIERVLSWESGELCAMRQKIRSFLLTRLWSFQARRLIQWLSEIMEN